jgi:hypothetical protein
MKKQWLLLTFLLFQLRASTQHLVGIETAYSNSFPQIINLDDLPESINGAELRFLYQYKNREAFLLSCSMSFFKPQKMVGYSWAELGMYRSESHDVIKPNAAILVEPSVCLFPIPNYLFLRLGAVMGYNKMPQFSTTSIYSNYNFSGQPILSKSSRNFMADGAFTYGFLFGSGFQINLNKNLSLKIEAQYRKSNLNTRVVLQYQTDGGPITTETKNIQISQTTFLPSIGILYQFKKASPKPQ